MSANGVEVRVKSLITRHLEVDPSIVRPSSTFFSDLGADSLAIVELVMALEEEFEVDIPDEVVENIRTVQDLIDYLISHT